MGDNRYDGKITIQMESINFTMPVWRDYKLRYSNALVGQQVTFYGKIMQIDSLRDAEDPDKHTGVVNLRYVEEHYAPNSDDYAQAGIKMRVLFFNANCKICISALDYIGEQPPDSAIAVPR